MASQQQCRPSPARYCSKSPPEQPLQVKVVGVFKSSSFHVAKSAAEVTVRITTSAGVSSGLPVSRLLVTRIEVRRRREVSRPAEQYQCTSQGPGSGRADFPLPGGLPLKGDPNEGKLRTLLGGGG